MLNNFSSFFFCRLQIFFKIIFFFFKKFFQECHQSVKQFDPDQAQHFIGPDLGPNCLQRLSADDTRRQKVGQLIPNKKPCCNAIDLTCFLFMHLLNLSKSTFKTNLSGTVWIQTRTECMARPRGYNFFSMLNSTEH